MDSANTLWMDALINKLEREASNRRNRSQGYWDGYCITFSTLPRFEEAVRDDIRRRERMAEAMYEI